MTWFQVPPLFVGPATFFVWAPSAKWECRALCLKIIRNIKMTLGPFWVVVQVKHPQGSPDHRGPLFPDLGLQCPPKWCYRIGLSRSGVTGTFFWIYPLVLAKQLTITLTLLAVRAYRWVMLSIRSALKSEVWFIVEELSHVSHFGAVARIHGGLCFAHRIHPRAEPRYYL